MYFKIKYIFGCVLLMLIASACGEKNDKPVIQLSGTIDIESIKDQVNGPIFLLLTNNSDFEQMNDDPVDSIIEMINVDPATLTFSIDLSEKGMVVDDVIYLIAFVDNNYSERRGFPNPDSGDWIGFYMDKGPDVHRLPSD